MGSFVSNLGSFGAGVALGAVSGVLDTLLVRQSRSISGIFPDVTVEENHLDELEITSHPVEKGADIADHAFKRPLELVMRVGWSPSRSISLNRGILGDLASRVTDITGNSYVQDAYEQLLSLQEALEPFEVVTGKRIYQNMLLKALAVTTDKQTENALFVEARFQEVILVYTQVTTLPPIAQQSFAPSTAAAVDAGVKQATQVHSSVLNKLLGASK